MTKLQQVHYGADMKQFLLDIQCTLISNLNQQTQYNMSSKNETLKDP